LNNLSNSESGIDKIKNAKEAEKKVIKLTGEVKGLGIRAAAHAPPRSGAITLSS
jgi:hypothetical protein